MQMDYKIHKIHLKPSHCFSEFRKMFRWSRLLLVERRRRSSTWLIGSYKSIFVDDDKFKVSGPLLLIDLFDMVYNSMLKKSDIN